METTHRKPGNSTVLLIGKSAEILLHELHNFGKREFKSTFRHLRSFVGTHGGGNKTLGRFTCSSILPSIAVSHHHNHRFSLALCNEIIQYLRSTAKSNPSFLITTCTMKQIKYRITLAAGFITSRSVNRQTAVHSQRRTIVPHATYRSMGYLIHFIQIGTVTTDDKYIGHGSHIPNHVNIARVHHSQSIHNKGVSIKFRLQWFGSSKFPNAILPLCQIGNARCIIIATRSLNSLWRQKITSNLHPYSLRSFQAKSNRVVIMNIRRDNRRTSPKSLLCKKGDTADQQHRCRT